MSDTTTGIPQSKFLLLLRMASSLAAEEGGNLRELETCVCGSENERERVGPAKAKARERETGNETIPYHLERSIISILVLKSQVLE